MKKEIITKATLQESPLMDSYLCTIKISNDALVEGLEHRILERLADDFIKDHGEEVLAMIDMNKLGTQINSKVLVRALQTLVKEGE